MLGSSLRSEVNIQGIIANIVACAAMRGAPPSEQQTPSPARGTRRTRRRRSIVVTNVPEASAGSTPSFSSPIGISAPAKPATTRLPIIAMPITSPSRASCEEEPATAPRSRSAKTEAVAEPDQPLAPR